MFSILRNFVRMSRRVDRLSETVDSIEGRCNSQGVEIGRVVEGWRSRDKQWEEDHARAEKASERLDRLEALAVRVGDAMDVGGMKGETITPEDANERLREGLRARTEVLSDREEKT